MKEEREIKEGRIVVIEGTDFSGKTTQYEKLKERFEAEGEKLGIESFPVYESESSVFVRRYLRGDYGREAKEINPRLASLFYGLDRYDSYKTREWGRVYDDGGNVLFARYTTSNILHQTSKFESKEERQKHIEWLEEQEYDVMGIPRPDMVVFLDMPPEMREELKKKRDKEQGGLASSGEELDIHEEDKDHLNKSYKVAKEVAREKGWYILKCVTDEGELRGIDDIHEELYRKVKEVYKQ